MLNDGTQGVWETSTYGGSDELWHDYDQALAAAEKRNHIELDRCYWRVEGEQGW